MHWMPAHEYIERFEEGYERRYGPPDPRDELLMMAASGEPGGSQPPLGEPCAGCGCDMPLGTLAEYCDSCAEERKKMQQIRKRESERRPRRCLDCGGAIEGRGGNAARCALHAALRRSEMDNEKSKRRYRERRAARGNVSLKAESN